MAEWFLLAMIGSRLIYSGPFTERDCQLLKRHLLEGFHAVCIERGLIDGNATPARR